jgi:Ca2+-binding EF-hand superfamily protein
MDLRLLLEKQPERLDEMLDAQFTKMDFLNSGYICAGDIQRTMNVSNDDIQIIMKEFDKNSVGFIDRQTFKKIFKELIPIIYS